MAKLEEHKMQQSGEMEFSVSGSAQINETLQAEINKLRKELKERENDLEDAEEEAEESRKSVKKLKANLEQLQDDICIAKRESKKYLNDFNVANDNLHKLEQEFQIREEALNFVTEILTAKRTDDENISKLYADIEETERFIRCDVRDALKATNIWDSSLEFQFFGQELSSWAIYKKKTWIQGKTTIAFVGEFSAGKTSIVNRLLSQDDPNVPTLPTSTKATTAIPTYITGGVGTFYQFVTPNNELKRISEDTFKRVSKEVLDQVKGVSSLIQYFVMTYKNPYLDKMSILDTPGFNSNDAEDAERTIEVINECDALFWVFDVNAGTVNRSSLKIIKEHLKKPLYVVINQIDTKSKKDVDAVEALISKTLSDEGVSVCDIIRFSTKSKEAGPLHVIMDAIHKIKKDESREILLETLIEFMSSEARKASKETNLALRNSNRKKSEVEELRNKFTKALDLTTMACDEAKELPQSNFNWFSEDDFRMSREQYHQFRNSMSDIAEGQMQILAYLFEKQKKAVSELEAAWQEHSDAQKRQCLIRDCADKLKQKAKMFSDRTNSTSFSTSSDNVTTISSTGNKPSSDNTENEDVENDLEDEKYMQEWNAMLVVWKKYFDANDHSNALVTLNGFYKEHDESPDFVYYSYALLNFMTDFEQGGNLQATLEDIENIIKQAENLASDDEDAEEVKEWWADFRKLSDKSKKKISHLSNAQIARLINRSKMVDDGSGTIEVNWDLLVQNFNKETGCNCTCRQFKSLVNCENAYSGTKINKEALIANMKNISIETPA